MDRSRPLFEPIRLGKEISRMAVFYSSAAIVVVLVGILAFLAGRKASPPTHPTPVPRIMTLSTSFFFWLGLGYLFLLLLMPLTVFLLHPVADRPCLLFGLLPAAVPWFGALGAVVISLEGVFLKNDQWLAKYNYWHIGRPLFGAVLGTVSYFLYVIIISAAGTPPKFLGADAGSTIKASDFIIYYVVAFLVGYREETFRELMKRATDLIMKPTNQANPTPSVVFRQGGVPAGAVRFAPGTAPCQTVEVQNSGGAALKAPVVEIVPSDPGAACGFALDQDHVTHGGDLAPGAGRTVDVVFTAKTPGSHAATLRVKAQNLPAPATILISGTAP
jgi:hypothetical protein